MKADISRFDPMNSRECENRKGVPVPVTDKTDGDRGRGKRLLSSSGIHITEDGDELEDNENREGTSEFAPL